MAAKVDLSGKRFGRLTVIADSGKRGRSGGILWDCLCDCGTRKAVRGDGLKSGVVVSCGCKKGETAKKMFAKHGCSGSALYRRWLSMKTRCYYPNAPGYPRYGGRGISICRLWRKDFSAFKSWAESSGFSKDLDIDRIDNNGPYAPWNCRFVSRTVNNLNRNSCGVVSHNNGRFYPYVKIYGKRKNLGAFATMALAKSVRKSYIMEIII